jgi:hypothetical protein
MQNIYPGRVPVSVLALLACRQIVRHWVKNVNLAVAVPFRFSARLLIKEPHIRLVLAELCLKVRVHPARCF